MRETKRETKFKKSPGPFVLSGGVFLSLHLLRMANGRDWRWTQEEENGVFIFGCVCGNDSEIVPFPRLMALRGISIKKRCDGRENEDPFLIGHESLKSPPIHVVELHLPSLCSQLHVQSEQHDETLMIRRPQPRSITRYVLQNFHGEDLGVSIVVTHPEYPSRHPSSSPPGLQSLGTHASAPPQP